MLWRSRAGGVDIVTESRSRNQQLRHRLRGPRCCNSVFCVCVLSADLKKLTTIFLNDLLLCILCVTFLWLPFVFLIIKVKYFHTDTNLLNLFSGTGTEYKNVIIQGRNRSRNMQRKKGNRCNNLIIWASQHWLKLLIR